MAYIYFQLLERKKGRGWLEMERGRSKRERGIEREKREGKRRKDNSNQTDYH